MLWGSVLLLSVKINVGGIHTTYIHILIQYIEINSVLFLNTAHNMDLTSSVCWLKVPNIIFGNFIKVWQLYVPKNNLSFYCLKYSLIVLLHETSVLQNQDPLISRPNLRNQNGELFTVKVLFWAGNCSLRSHTHTYFTATCCTQAQHARAETTRRWFVTCDWWRLDKVHKNILLGCYATQQPCAEALRRPAAEQMSCNSRYSTGVSEDTMFQTSPDETMMTHDPRLILQTSIKVIIIIIMI